MILRKLKEAAEAYLGHKVNKAVITVPAYFNDAQRQATKDAGQIAGLEVMRIINEPTAAALAYGLEKKEAEKICVFDLGGGTFDVSVLEVADGVFRVISTNGDTHLGGDDFDRVLIDYVADEFKRSNGIDLRKDPMALQRLQEACEKAKKELSSLQIDRHQPAVHHGRCLGPKHLQMTLTRAKFEQLGDRLIERCRGPVQQAMKDAKLQPQRDRRSRARRRLDPHSQGAGNRQDDVRQGAAQGRQSGRSRGRGRRDPRRRAGGRSQGHAAAGRDAAVAGHRDPGRHHDQARRAQHDHPHRAKESFQHGRRQSDGRHRQGLPGRTGDGRRQPAARPVQSGRNSARAAGVPQIEVKFDIDANGILNVSAKDLGTGKEQTVRIEQIAAGCPKTKSSACRKEAESHADEDKKKRRLAEAAQPGRHHGFQLEKLMQGARRDKLGDADKEAGRSGDRKDARSGQGRRRRCDQGGHARIGAGVARLEQDALCQDRAPAGGGPGHGRAAAAGASPQAAAGRATRPIDAEFEVKSTIER